MKNENSTAVAPILETIFKGYTAPGWLIFFCGTILVLSLVIGLVCYRFSKCSTWTYSGCSIICACCTGCLIASARNCTLFTKWYKVCVVNCYDCLTFAPKYIRAQNINEVQMPDCRLDEVVTIPVRRQVPVLKIGGPDPFDF